MVASSDVMDGRSYVAMRSAGGMSVRARSVGNARYRNTFIFYRCATAWYRKLNYTAYRDPSVDLYLSVMVDDTV
jgi:hypothetical protein